MPESLSAKRLAEIRDRDESLYSSRSARDLAQEDRHLLLAEVDRLRAKYEPPVPDGLRTASDWCALYGLIVVDPAGWPSSGRPHWTDPIGLTDFADRIARSTAEGRGLARLIDDAARVAADA